MGCDPPVEHSCLKAKDAFDDTSLMSTENKAQFVNVLDGH